MLAIIVVNWNVCEVLRACLKSLHDHAATLHRQAVIVVDNASTDGSVEMVRREFPDAYLIANTTNRGYTGGNNVGLFAAARMMDEGERMKRDTSSFIPQPSYFLILNPDTEVTPGALDAMLVYADANPDVGVLGPQLRYPDGSVQSSKRHFPTLATAIFESTPLQRFAPPTLLHHFYARGCADDAVCDVDWLVGAVLLVRREAYDKVGALDEATFFMYSEEIDWCKRIKDAGWRVVYFPRATIVHYEGKSSEQVSTRRMIHFNTSKVRYLAKHHGAAQAAIARAVLLIQFAGQWCVEAAKWLVGHKRRLRAERMQAYVAVLKSGLR